MNMHVSSFLNLLIYLIIVGCIFGVLWWLINVLPIIEPFKGVLRIVFMIVSALFVIFVLLGLLGVVPPLRFS